MQCVQPPTPERGDPRHRPRMQVAVADLPEFPPRHRIGIKQRGLILRPSGDGPLAWSWARWSLVPPGRRRSRPTRSTTPEPISYADGLGRRSSASGAWCPRADSGAREARPKGRGGFLPLGHCPGKRLRLALLEAPGKADPADQRSVTPGSPVAWQRRHGLTDASRPPWLCSMHAAIA